MNDFSPIGRIGRVDPLSNPLDALLADIAINVQLPPGLHGKAGRRYAAIHAYAGRSGSPLEDLIVQFYTQGSMAIDATNSTRGTDNEYDLDAVLEAVWPPGTMPSDRLHLLWLALKDYPGCTVIRQTRCVTVQYADGMHVDVTPSRRIPATKDFESVIFHAKHGTPTSLHAEIPMNAFAFASWYNRRTPDEQWFSAAYNRRTMEALELLAKDEAFVHDVPDQTPLPLKSVTTVALQLNKRFRDIWSIGRPGRYPPSVMLSCHAGHAAKPGLSLSEAVIRQARWTARAIDEAVAVGQLVDVRNPEMSSDKFTDRWPENQTQQKAFAVALHSLANGLEMIRQGEIELEDVQEWLRECFGPRVVSRSIKTMNDRNGRILAARQHGYGGAGGLYVPAAPAIIASGATFVSNVPARAHTNMGDRRR
jgi:hypothetical protein